MSRVTEAALARELLGEARWPEFAQKGYALVGDVHAPSVEDVAGALTAVPVGVGRPAWPEASAARSTQCSAWD